MQLLKKENKLNNTKDYFALIKEVLPFKFGHKLNYYAHVKTYGCQQNFADSEKITWLLKKCSFKITEDETVADLIVFNTCAIRQSAENRVFGNLGAIKKLRKSNPRLAVVICGCMPQQEKTMEKIKEKFPFVNLILGTNYLENILELFYKALLSKNKTVTYRSKEVETSEILENIQSERQNKIKASVPIMYGCDNFCSYCIVPHVRGRERSRAPLKILNEVTELIINKGYKEILLLGQNVNSYGKNLNEQINFAQLLEVLDSITEKDYWLRFMTSHPKDITKELVDVIANSKHIPGCIHLPVQSGNNRILRSMNRKYTKRQYLEIISYIKKKIPGVCISSDIIVGFPGETEKEFLDTVDLIREVKFTNLYTFIYSKRYGTPAFELEDKTTYKEKTKRLNYLINVQNKVTSEIFDSYINTTQKVLVESESYDHSTLIARTAGNILVKIVCSKACLNASNSSLLGRFLNVKINGKTRTYLKANLV